MIRKALSVFLCVISVCAVCICLTPFTAYDVSAALLSQKDTDTLRSGLRDLKKIIKIKKSVSKKTGSFDDMCDKIFDELDEELYRIFTEKEFFYVSDDGKFDIEGYENNGYYDITVTLDIDYISTKSSLKKDRKTFDKAVRNMISGVDKKWSDLQKCAYLHDKLILETDYLDNGDSRFESTPYAALVSKKALCVGYSRAYAILLNEVGIESVLVNNDDHEWNLVKADGKWYHVDCTYDDPTTTTEDDEEVSELYCVSHEFFMKSDKALKEHGKYSPSGKAVSSGYDRMDWDTTSAFAVYDKYIIYNNGSSICSYDTKAGTVRKLFSVKDKWYYDKGNYEIYIDGNYTQLCLNKSALYYNTPHSVKKYDLKTGKTSTVFTNSQKDGYILGLTCEGGDLYAWITYDLYADKKTCIAAA